MKAWAIHEADGQDVTMQEEVAYSLVCGGGKPGQGFPCVMVVQDEQQSDNFQRRYNDKD